MISSFCVLRNIPYPRPQSFSPVFSSRRFMALNVTFMSVIHFELIFLCNRKITSTSPQSILFIYLFIFMTMLGLCFCARAFSSCGKWGPLFIAVRRPLTIAASLVAEHRLQTRRLSTCGSRA